MQTPPNQLPPQVQKELEEFQQVGQKLELLTQQKLTIENSISEKESSIKELESMEEDATVYRQIGSILVKKGRNKVLEQLKDEKLTLEMRKKTLERNEPSLRKNYDELRLRIQKRLNTGT